MQIMPWLTTSDTWTSPCRSLTNSSSSFFLPSQTPRRFRLQQSNNQRKWAMPSSSNGFQQSFELPLCWITRSSFVTGSRDVTSRLEFAVSVLKTNITDAILPKTLFISHMIKGYKSEHFLYRPLCKCKSLQVFSFLKKPPGFVSAEHEGAVFASKPSEKVLHKLHYQL